MSASQVESGLEYRRWPVLGPETAAAVERVLGRGILSGAAAPEVAGLEREWSEHLGVAHTVGTASGTAALVVAFTVLAGNAAPERRQVIVPAYTFGATVAAVLLAGLEPLFVAVDPETFNLVSEELDSIDPSTVLAVAPVHLFGLPCDIDRVLAWARKHDVAVVEDCAQAHGAYYQGRRVGTFGDFACFSLQSSKHLGAGEGGLLCTHDSGLAESARSVCSFGFAVDDDGVVRREGGRDGYSVFREHLRLGGMSRLQELPAAVARAQLGRLEANVARVQEMAAELIDGIEDLPAIVVPPRLDDRTHVFHKVRVGIDAHALAPSQQAGAVREALRAALHARGLETTLWQVPVLPLHQAFEAYAGERDWAASECQTAVERSFILFSEDRPLIAQDPAFVGPAVKAFRAAYEDFVGALG